MNEKKVSIIMGIYNCADTLDEAIESILSQTYTNWQMIMCDDGSSDNTYEVAKKYVEKYPNKFILIRNEQNMGLNYTLNNCLSIADGKYVARMDGDDISVPERFEKQVEFLETNPEFAIVSSNMIFFDTTGDWGTTHAIEKPEIKDFAYHAPVHCHAPVMIRREAYLAVGGYTVDKRLLRFEDCNLWYKLYAAGYKGYNLQESLYKMRDDHAAFKRRTFKLRMRAVYVQRTGFKLIKMPLRYYYVLVILFFKCVIVGLMPKSLYKMLRRKKLSKQKACADKKEKS